MSPQLMAEILSLHPAQQAAYQELIMWGNAGVQNGMAPSDAAIEKALVWAKQVPIPPEVIKDPLADFQEKET